MREDGSVIKGLLYAMTLLLPFYALVILIWRYS